MARERGCWWMEGILGVMVVLGVARAQGEFFTKILYLLNFFKCHDIFSNDDVRYILNIHMYLF